MLTDEQIREMATHYADKYRCFVGDKYDHDAEVDAATLVQICDRVLEAEQQLKLATDRAEVLARKNSEAVIKWLKADERIKVLEECLEEILVSASGSITLEEKARARKALEPSLSPEHKPA